MFHRIFTPEAIKRAVAAFLMSLALLPGAFAQNSGPPPLGDWPRATPAEVGLNEALLARARDYALRGGGSGIVIKQGKLAYSWGDLKAKYDLKSTTKSIGVTALGLAIYDGKVKLDDPATTYLKDLGRPPDGNSELGLAPNIWVRNVPDSGPAPANNRQQGWLKDITLLQLATHTAGFDFQGGFEPLLFKPGTMWSYTDSGANWLADCLTAIWGRDLQELMFDRIFAPLGITRDDLFWRDNQYRPKALNGITRREFGSGVHANVDAMARIGFMYLHAGRIGSRQMIPAPFVAMLRQPMAKVQGLPVLRPEKYADASNHYGLFWWNNGDGSIKDVPRDAYWSWGLYDSYIIVIPSLDLVVARAGKSFDEARPVSPNIQTFLGFLAAAVDPVQAQVRPPYPPSPVIESIEWAPLESILRSGSDCDNLPSTWADDGDLYITMGDCRGFYPLREQKIGMQFGKIVGMPEDFQGINIPSDGEDMGQGPKGKKGSGILMVDGVLYVLARNSGNSQLGWSTDYSKSWTWSDWKFTISFGHATFLDFGQNYAHARDNYVYIYSPDSDSAYESAAGVVLARVPKNRIRDRSAYEFFQSLDSAGNPVWTNDIAHRGQVFRNPPAGCYRTHVSYNLALKRYFLNQILIGSDYSRFQAGFGVYDSPEPWGPWTTAYFTPMWDTGPGENQNFPPKWMSADGKTMYLIFSNNDYFSVRRATLKLR
jgi:CubicO group peptidase (beta-lactamase class C family)